MLIRGSGRDRLRKLPFLGREITAGDKKRFSQRAASNCHWFNLAAALLSKANYLECLLDMQFARSALGVAPIVIVNAIRQIRMLLYLTKHEALANRVRCASGDEN